MESFLLNWHYYSGYHFTLHRVTWRSPKGTFGTAGAKILKAGCPACHPTNIIKALQGCYANSNSGSLCLRFNGHFPGEPGLAGVYWSKGWWRWWWTTGAISRAKLQPNNHHQQTNIQFFLQAECPSCRPTNSVKALKGKISHSMDLLTPSSPGGLPTLSLTTNSGYTDDYFSLDNKTNNTHLNGNFPVQPG